jgi:hypothetical protein
MFFRGGKKTVFAKEPLGTATNRVNTQLSDKIFRKMTDLMQNYVVGSLPFAQTFQRWTDATVRGSPRFSSDSPPRCYPAQGPNDLATTHDVFSVFLEQFLLAFIMIIAIVGFGSVGKRLATLFAAAGHQILVGSRKIVEGSADRMLQSFYC